MVNRILGRCFDMGKEETSHSIITLLSLLIEKKAIIYCGGLTSFQNLQVTIFCPSLLVLLHYLSSDF